MHHIFQDVVSIGNSQGSMAIAVASAILFSSASVKAATTFTRVTTSPVSAASGATGGAWGDFNQDGWVDLFVSFNSGTSSILYTNNGHGGFAVDTTAGIAAGTGSSWGSAWGDYDNDGNIDLMGSVYGAGNNYVLHNNGTGAFTRLTNDPLVTSGASGNNVVWSDYDNDGFIDAFFAGSKNLLFRNNGDGTFTKVTNSAMALDGGGQGCAWGDYDNDGYPDLFVTRVNQPNLLYHNNGDGSFARNTNGPFAKDASTSQGCSWGDYDNDGFLDLVVCNVGAKNFLYHNNGDGTFAKVTNSAIASVVASSSGSAWADYDNDGYLDLFIAVRGGASLLWHNNGDGTFTRVTGVDPVSLSGTWVGAAWGDYNNDGFPDLFVGNLSGNNALYLNNGNSNNWITVQCLGRLSNRSAIGAKVRIQATIAGKTMWQVREISGGGGLASQNDLRAQFGLGNATNVEILRIEWPSGIVQQFTNVVPKQFLTVKEPLKLEVTSGLTKGLLQISTLGGKGIVYQMEVSSALTNWSPLQVETNLTGTLQFAVPINPSDHASFYRVKEQ